MIELFYLFSLEDDYFCFGAYYLLDLWKMVPVVSENLFDCGLSIPKIIKNVWKDSTSYTSVGDFLNAALSCNDIAISAGKNYYEFNSDKET